MSGLDVHDNEEGVRIFNFSTEGEPPENDVIIERSVLKNNLRAITLEGNGQVTDCEITDNQDTERHEQYPKISRGLFRSPRDSLFRLGWIESYRSAF